MAIPGPSGDPFQQRLAWLGGDLLQQTGLDDITCDDEEFGSDLYILVFGRGPTGAVVGVEVQGIAIPVQWFTKSM